MKKNKKIKIKENERKQNKIKIVTWKKGYCKVWLALGLCCGSYFIKSCIITNPSGDAFGINWANAVGTNWGNLNCICPASLIPSGQLLIVGDPIIIS